MSLQMLGPSAPVVRLLESYLGLSPGDYGDNQRMQTALDGSPRLAELESWDDVPPELRQDLLTIDGRDPELHELLPPAAIWPRGMFDHQGRLPWWAFRRKEHVGVDAVGVDTLACPAEDTLKRGLQRGAEDTLKRGLQRGADGGLELLAEG